MSDIQNKAEPAWKAMPLLAIKVGILVVLVATIVGCATTRFGQTSHEVRKSKCELAMERNQDFPEGKADANGLLQFIVIHSLYGVDKVLAEDPRAIARKINSILEKMGPERIRWVESFVGEDEIVGFYRAEGFADICEYIDELDFLTIDIIPTISIIGPETADGIDVDLANRPSIPDGLQQFIIVRMVPEAGKMAPGELIAAAQTSNSMVANMGPEKIHWDYSCVGGNAIVCRYWAEYYKDICHHADMLRDLVVAELIIPVTSIIGPETAEEP